MKSAFDRLNDKERRLVAELEKAAADMELISEYETGTPKWWKERSLVAKSLKDSRNKIAKLLLKARK